MEWTITEKLLFSLNTAFTAMIIVFGILVILMYVIKLQSYLVNKFDTYISNRNSNKVEKSKEDFENEILCDEDDESEFIDVEREYELVAAIMGALEAYIGKPASQLNIKSIKRINNRTDWNR